MVLDLLCGQCNEDCVEYVCLMVLVNVIWVYGLCLDSCLIWSGIFFRRGVGELLLYFVFIWSLSIVLVVGGVRFVLLWGELLGCGLCLLDVGDDQNCKWFFNECCGVGLVVFGVWVMSQFEVRIIGIGIIFLV